MQQPVYSYWERTAFVGGADVIVIGSGLVGLSAALRLKTQAPALNVLVLERGFLPSGASTKNAGFACFGTVSEQLDALERTSPEEVARAVNYKWRGLQRLRENLSDANIGFEQHGGYELFFDNANERPDRYIEAIPKINQVLKDAIGGHDIYAVADEKIAAFGFSGISKMIYNPFEGQLHTGKMMRALLQKVYSAGILVLNNCDILSLHRQNNGVSISTSHGEFKAGKVILATNAFASQLYPQLDVVPGRGQVLVTKPVPGLKLKGTYHFDNGYYYFRNIDGRVLFGGGRNLDYKAEQTYDFGHTDLVKKQLINYLTNNILPGLPFEIDQWWSGVMGFGSELTPIVKEIEPGIFCAVRCNGMGVAMGSLVGEEVADLLLQTI